MYKQICSVTMEVKGKERDVDGGDFGDNKLICLYLVDIISKYNNSGLGK